MLAELSSPSTMVNILSADFYKVYLSNILILFIFFKKISWKKISDHGDRCIIHLSCCRLTIGEGS